MMAGMSVDAMVKMTQAELENWSDEAGSFMADAVEGMSTIPPYIMEPLYSQYMKGARFVMSLRQAGGWELVSRAYEEPPLSAEQVLHPEKYLSERDDPTPVVLPELAYLADLGWVELDAAVHGEAYLDLLLRLQGASRKVARRASEGWDGDVYHGWEGPGGEVMIALVTTWDSEQDAGEFFDAYRGILPTKYAELRELESEDEDVFRFACGEPALGEGRLVLRGREVFAVEGGDAALVDRIAGDLRAMKLGAPDARDF